MRNKRGSDKKGNNREEEEKGETRGHKIKTEIKEMGIRKGRGKRR